MTGRQARYEARRRESGWRMISVRLDAETLAALEQLAERYGGDKSAAIRAAINSAEQVSAENEEIVALALEAEREWCQDVG